MNFLWRLGRQYQKCKEHSQEAVAVCYEQKCKNNRLLCKDCKPKHQKHTLTHYEEHRQSLSRLEKHLKARENFQSSLDQHKKTASSHLEKMYEDMKNSLFAIINHKHCSSRFLQLQKLYKKQGDYFPLLHQFAQPTPEQVYREIEAMVAERQKTVLKAISKMEVSFDVKQFAVDNLEENPFSQKENRIKRLLPFNCTLKLRFKASDNSFLTKKMYAVNIRGPVLLYVESNKGRHFGGYSSVMFPKYDEDFLESRNVQAFLYSLDHQELLPLKPEYRKFAIKGGPHFGFGQGDLLIADECNKGNISWAEVGRSYREPANVKGPLNEWLGGAAYFSVLEYEVYSVQILNRK